MKNKTLLPYTAACSDLVWVLWQHTNIFLLFFFTQQKMFLSYNIFLCFDWTVFTCSIKVQNDPPPQWGRRTADANLANSQVLSLPVPFDRIRKQDPFSLNSCKMIATLQCDITWHLSNADRTDSKWGAEQPRVGRCTAPAPRRQADTDRRPQSASKQTKQFIM